MRWIAFFLLAANVGYFLWSMVPGIREVVPGQSQEASVTDDVAHVPTLVLLSEQLSAAQRQAAPSSEKALLSSESPDAVVKAVEAEGVAVAPSVLVCRELGAFDQEAVAQQVLDLLVKQSVETAEILPRKVSENKTYWLTLSGSKASQTIEKEVKAIKKMGLDAQKMTEGHLLGKIAAGPFASYEVAESYLFRLSAAEVHVAIEPIVDVVFEYWVRVEWMYEPGFVSPAAILNQFLSPLQPTIGKKLKQNACS